MSGQIVPAQTRITNPFDSETFIFTHPHDGGASTRFDVILGAGGSGGGNAIPHIHPKTDEIFTVRRGRLMVSIDGEEHFVDAGQSATVHAGQAHFFRNAHDGETEATVTFTNAQQHQRFFIDLARLTAEKPHYFSKNGDPKLLTTALKLNAYRDHLYIAGPPIALQKFLFALLSPLAFLLGYRLAVSPLRGAGLRAARKAAAVRPAS
ncbi:cupin domain-containing protein [Martelella radicis]|uniref:Mannose-6-phosphate isomerase-like protein (Cupin superfamily) n=1 Tax=Martelella radicis TaxID=1397476 RepID=A0A7W6KLW2_9HYPH|nr:cupin domain-containing protein [Martelella radicis]MBB4123495.1 mannose-6-phosphate isomerase-like protein (cupin superfamily) [Martelella radicis]